MNNKTDVLLLVTKRLVLMTSLNLALVVGIFGSLIYHDRLMLSWVVFCCGVLGGFVSIQQRLRTLHAEELDLLSRSWSQILLIPIYGGVFALVLYVSFLSDIISGEMFPQFAVARFVADASPAENLKLFLTSTMPETGQDVAKLFFWSFVAGFSERFVPQLIARSQTKVEAADKP